MSDARRATRDEVVHEFEGTRELAHQRLTGVVEGIVQEDEDDVAGLMVRDVMTATPAAASSDATAVDAARAMVAEDVGSLPVVEDGALVGMVTDRDLVASVLARDLDPNKVPVAECCSGNPVVAHPDESLEAALRRMAKAQVRRLPVVDGEALVGIVAQADVARAARLDDVGAMVQGISRG
jgi:CBS domain-containing protein